MYIIRPKPGPVAKNATPRPSSWKSNPRLLDYWTSALPTELQKPLTTSVNAKYYYKYTLILHRHYHLINIYTELAPKLSATASVAQLVEHWSSNPEDAGSIPSRKALELHFS